MPFASPPDAPRLDHREPPRSIGSRLLLAATLTPLLLALACAEAGSEGEPCPDTAACASSNAAFEGVWRIEEVIMVDGDGTLAPEVGDIVIYDAFRLRAFGNTDTSPESLDFEAGPVLDFLNTVDEDGADFRTTVAFNGLRPPVTIEIQSRLLADDVMRIEFLSDLTEPTQVSLRLVKTVFLADPPGNDGVALSLLERAGTYRVVASDRPLPPLLEGGLLAVDFNGQVSAAFGRMPLDPRDSLDPSFALNRSSGREIALQLTDENALDAFGTVSLRAISTDRDTMVAILVDDGLLDPLAERTRFELALTRIAEPELCGSVETGPWHLQFFEDGAPLLELGQETDLRVTRLYQAGCEIRIDSLDLTLPGVDPDAGVSLEGRLRVDATWDVSARGFENLGLQDPDLQLAFTTTRDLSGTLRTSDGRVVSVVGSADDPTR